VAAAIAVSLLGCFAAVKHLELKQRQSNNTCVACVSMNQAAVAGDKSVVKIVSFHNMPQFSFNIHCPNCIAMLTLWERAAPAGLAPDMYVETHAAWSADGYTSREH
jgi:hypothetical protein